MDCEETCEIGSDPYLSGTGIENERNFGFGRNEITGVKRASSTIREPFER